MHYFIIIHNLATDIPAHACYLASVSMVSVGYCGTYSTDILSDIIATQRVVIEKYAYLRSFEECAIICI